MFVCVCKNVTIAQVSRANTDIGPTIETEIKTETETSTEMETATGIETETATKIETETETETEKLGDGNIRRHGVATISRID